jgi:hypothetical protein
MNLGIKNTLQVSVPFLIPVKQKRMVKMATNLKRKGNFQIVCGQSMANKYNSSHPNKADHSSGITNGQTV